MLKSMYMHARLINVQDISKAQDMLDKLSSLMQCYPQEEKLREYWSWGVQSYFMGVGRDFFHMQKMLEDFGQVTKAYPHERKIVTRWVYCVVEFLSRSPSVDFEKWHVLIENLIDLTNRHPDDVSIRKKTQEAIKHFTNRAV